MENSERNVILTDMKQVGYQNALEYWSKIPATVDGVLGGFGFISNIDIEASKIFLKSVLQLPNAPSTSLALDCGAGIGRITKHLLIPSFNKVDVVEPDPKFINTVRSFVGDSESKLGTLYDCSLQDYEPDKQYDMIWNQWVLGHLDDEDLVSYLSRCRSALADNGVIVVKENVTSSGIMEKDDIDSSVTRPLKQLLAIFKAAKLKRIKQCRQTNFPEGIYPVYMFALIPNNDEHENINNNNDIQT